MTAKFTPEDVVAAYKKHGLRARALTVNLRETPEGVWLPETTDGCCCALGALYVDRGVADCRWTRDIAEVFGVSMNNFVLGFDYPPGDGKTADYLLGAACRKAVQEAGLWVEEPAEEAST